MSEYSTGEDTRSGYITGRTFGVKEATYEVIDGDAVFEGDIVLGRVDEVPSEPPADVGLEAVVITGDAFRWPHGVVA